MSLPTADGEEIDAQSTLTVPGEKRPEEASSSSTKPEWISELMSHGKITNTVTPELISELMSRGKIITMAKPEWISGLLMSCSKITNTVIHGDTFPVMFTAPDNMRLVDRDDPVFDPVLVSIGPFHHNKFPAMEDHKTRILSSMLCRLTETGSITSEEKLMELVDAMKVLEVDARGCYSKAFPGIDFPKMMVYDGCFTLEIFRMHAGLYMKDGDDPIFFSRWMLPVLALDIVKLENQIPYSVIVKLYDMTKLPNEPPLNQLAGPYLAVLCPPELTSTLPIEGFREAHLLSMFHSTFTSSENDHPIRIHAHPNPDDKRNCNSFPSVTNLLFSGIKVVKKKAAATLWNLLDIEYRNRKLEVPALVVDHNTKILMRNLVAYEQCNKTILPKFTSYVTFMDALVNSAEDVSKMLNSLTANIKYDMNEGYLADINNKVYSDHHSTWPQLRATFNRNVNSREGITYIVTFFALYLTVLQTLFALLSYFHPPR